MSNSDHAIIKIESLRIQEDYPAINKIIGSIDANNFAKLIDVAGLGANPRESKSNTVTDAIMNTLENSPELMVFKSKGLLISTSKCTTTDSHQNIKLSFADKNHEGVLDGGHNMFAIALFILKKISGDDKRVKKIKNWGDLIVFWEEKRSIITIDKLNNFIFKIPVEVIFPKKETEQKLFFKYVSEISSARNTNSPLKQSTKSDHNGYYDFLKACLDSEINEKIEWKQNETNKSINPNDIIALSFIPLYALQEQGGLHSDILKINPAAIYSNSGKYIEIFNDIIDSVLKNNEFSNEFESAMKMMIVIPKLYDSIYEKFPDLFIGRLSAYGCPRSDKKKQYKSPFYEIDVEYKISDGFIYPIIFAFHKLMKYEKEQKRLVWAIDPEYFLKEKLNNIERLDELIKKIGKFPSKIGRDNSAYTAMALTFMELLNK